MKNKNFFKKNTKAGQAMITATILLTLITSTIIFGLTSPIVRQIIITGDLSRSRESYFLAEAGMEDVVYRLKNNIPVSSNETLSLNGFTATTETTDVNGSKEVTSTGDRGGYIRKVQTRLVAGVGVGFNYGVQVGNGGFTLRNNAGVDGNVYANGNITGLNGSYITGTAIAANSAALITDQSNSTPIPPTSSINIRNTAAAQDFAQSFQVSTTSPINKIQVYIKKTGNPSGNPTVRITEDSGGIPAAASLTTATINPSSVTTSYGWLDVSFVSNPELIPGTTYWLVIDNSSQHLSNYYTIGANSSYASGVAKTGLFGGTWNDTSLDGYFNIFLGGITGVIDNVDIGTGSVGDAKAHTVTNSSVAGGLYCQSGSGNTTSGGAALPCDTSQPDPSPVSFPISEANITQWKSDALDGGIITGSYATTSPIFYLGPAKITGNLTLNGGQTLILTGTLWVEGNIILGNGASIYVDSGYGTGSGVIVSDGYQSFSNNVEFYGSGDPSSYILLLTTSDCPTSPSCVGNNAIQVSNNTGAVILNAQNGTIHVNNNGGAKEMSAYGIDIDNNSTITYETGLVSVIFSTGPGGAWNIRTWKEVQ